MHRLKVNTIEKEHTKLTKLYCLFLMAKYIFKTMVMMDQLLVIIINYKISDILITIQKSFLVKHIVLIFLQSEQLFCKTYCFNFQSNHNL